MTLFNRFSSNLENRPERGSSVRSNFLPVKSENHFLSLIIPCTNARVDLEHCFIFLFFIEEKQMPKIYFSVHLVLRHKTGQLTAIR